jgi:hypothetical protein
MCAAELNVIAKAGSHWGKNFVGGKISPKESAAITGCRGDQRTSTCLHGV